MIKNMIFNFVVVAFFFTNSLNAKEPSLSSIIKKLESETLSDNLVKTKGSCRYWYTFSRNAYSKLSQYDIHKKDGVFYKLQDATLKVHSKALSICYKEDKHLYSYLHDDGYSSCGNCLFRREIENLPLVIENTEKREKARIKKEKELKDDANKFIKYLSKNTFLSKKIKKIESETLKHPDVHVKGKCTYWYRFTRNSYDELFHQNIHKKNGIFFKLKDVTLKLHDKAIKTCKAEEAHYYSYLNGKSSCGNCLSRQDIVNLYSLIEAREKQAKVNQKEEEERKEAEKKRKADTDIFLESLK